ncbi:MAG: polysaccharide deacetylase family protein [Burkholderiaceae bacterium]|nr:polysaccharide deacetylase family protein [Burkholderiaceae bacterium]
MTIPQGLSESGWPYLPRIPRAQRPVVRWPGDARIAFWIAPNIEFYELYPPVNPVRASWPRPAPDILNYSWRDYGNRVGVWRCLEVFDRHKVTGSVSLNAAMCERLPEVVAEFVERGWELFYHGLYNTRYAFGQSEAQELADIESSCRLITRLSGEPVRGFLAPALTYTEASLRVARQAGIDYVFDLFREDEPFPLNPALGRMLSVPYQVELNDFHHLVMGGLTPDRYFEQFKAHFDRLYREGEASGKVVGLPLHPYVIGSPHYIGVLNEMLRYVSEHDHVWHARADQIADWYFANVYEEAVAEIETATGKAT